MAPPVREILTAFSRLLRTPGLSRTIVGLLSVAIALLLAVNLATFFMIQRTARFNDTVEQAQQARRAARTLMITMLDAETGQRGMILTGRPEFLSPYLEAERALPDVLNELDSAALDDPDLAVRVDRLRDLASERMNVAQTTLDLARTGRVGEAIQIVRSGEGKVLMDEIRRETDAIDEVVSTRIEFRTRQSEWAAGATVFANALAGALILALAGAVFWMVRRHIEEIHAARVALDRVNMGLETKVRERTADLSRANEEIQRFAYIVSHDLRAPLVNVMGYTSELEMAGKTLDQHIALAEKSRAVHPEVLTAVREDMPEAVSFIRASTEKMDRLINAILKLSRDGRRSLIPEVIDMNRLIGGIASSVRHQTLAADGEIGVDDLPPLDSDRLSIEQIFGNLIDNAVKYLDPARPGRISVSGVTREDGWVEYRVADNGRGISPRDHERIFELFRRSGRQDRPGEGLGLAFVRNSVRRLGGDITVESELGEGSTFVLKFPKRLNVEDAGDRP